MIRRWKPWEQSAGPRTANGRAKAARNARMGAARPILRRVSRVLKEQSDYLKEA